MKYLTYYRAISHLKISVLFGIVLIMGSFLLEAYPVRASSSSATSRQAGTSNSVTVLILDMSGSMAVNDPRGYRCSAADAFIDMSGVGNYIGVIGLDGDGTRGGPHNFALAQQWTSEPVDMSVVRDRNNLKNTIKEKSHNCAPDNITPTYDALNKALHMLEDSAQGKEIPGSVILLTDGEPDDGGSSRDVAAQINAITTELLPQFRQHSWPIDTVALGQNAPVDESGTQFATFHDFLQGISNATTGTFYDDARGIVPGITPLNIAPFFADIFARYNNRTLKNDIGATSLAGNALKRNFNVTPYTDHLDIITVKDQADTKVTLLDANGRTITPQAGISIYQDPYYVIFSIDSPQQGTWELDVHGTGQFLMESLKKTTLALAPLAVSQNGLISTGATQSFASGQPLTIKTALTNQGHIISDPTTYTVLGTISYDGIAGAYSQDFALHGDPSGTYMGTVTVQDDKPTGSYEIAVRVSTGSLDNILTSRRYAVRIGQFPLPLLLSQAGNPTEETVTTQVVQWDPFLSFIYSMPLPGFLTQWALQGHPAAHAVVQGQVTLRNQTYSGATISASVTHQGASSTSSVSVQDEASGKFSVQFSVTNGGPYTIHFITSGAFSDTHGDFGSTQSDVQIMVVTSSAGQEILAWLLTLVYIWLLVCLFNLFRFFVLAHPFGGLIHSQDGVVVGRFDFKRARRSLFQTYFRPNLVYSRQASLPQGLVFRFKHRGGIEVRLDSAGRTNWQSGDGGRLSQQYHEVRELRYYPASMDESDEEMLGISTYTIKSKQTGGPGGSGYDYEKDLSSTRSRNYKNRYTARVKQSGKSRKRSSSGSYDNYDDLYDY